DAGHEVVASVRSAPRAAEVRVAAATGSDAPLEFALADLGGDDGWDDAMAGCDYVLHVASPLALQGVTSESLGRPARDGTVRVLEAAERAGVKRVVVTSSCAAATPHATQLSGTVDETCWTDADESGLAPYRRSKVLAELAAWDFVARRDCSLELTT